MQIQTTVTFFSKMLEQDSGSKLRIVGIDKRMPEIQHGQE